MTPFVDNRSFTLDDPTRMKEMFDKKIEEMEIKSTHTNTSVMANSLIATHLIRSTALNNDSNERLMYDLLS